MRKLKVEIRADGLHIAGYVNVTEKLSRPVITGKGQKVVELIEPRAFEQALSRAGNVAMTKDHNADYVLAETRSESLELFEDAIGLHADAYITDEATIGEARAGKLKGWSFGMTNIADTIEEREGALPLRRVKNFDLDHITLVVNKTPAYAATSIEMRTEDEISEVETRTGLNAPEVIDKVPKEPEAPKYDNTLYKNRAAAAKRAAKKEDK